MESWDLMIQKLKITVFARSWSRDHQLSDIINMGSRLLWSLICKSQKSGSRGKINHEIIGWYIFMIWYHGILHFFNNMGSWYHRFLWHEIMESYIFMIWCSINTPTHISGSKIFKEGGFTSNRTVYIFMIKKSWSWKMVYSKSCDRIDFWPEVGG